MEGKPVKIGPRKSDNARNTLGWVTLFLGELRDGLTMINMQSAFLISSRGYSEKQAGILFFVFGMSQFIFQTPAGYLMDYSNRKVLWLSLASIGTTILTVGTAFLALENGANLGLMVLIKFLQGGITALIPPGLNSITQGIVGSVGMTQQVSRNEMNNHLGTAAIVLIGSVLAFLLYPDIGLLFIVSPIACAGVVIFLYRIKPHHIDHNAARGLVMEAEPDGSFSVKSKQSQYIPPLTSPSVADKAKKKKKDIQTAPSFNFGFAKHRKDRENDEINIENNQNPSDASSVFSTMLQAESPLGVLRDTTLITFTLICFLFHTSNGCVLPLTMQSLALEGGRTGILMSGLCIIVAQSVMVISAKVCGDYSSRFGRKPLFLIGLFSVSIRCAVLVLLITIRDHQGETNIYIQALILSTQIFDGIGAGVFGTMYILVTSDISGGTGRFSLTLGITTAAMSIGGTISGYLGEMLAEDFGYHAAFGILGIMSLVPALLYLFIMPETLPNYNEQFIGMSRKHNNYKPNNGKPINPILSLASINEHHKEGDAAMEDHEDDVENHHEDKPSGTTYTELV